jgi:hypothetical protein
LFSKTDLGKRAPGKQPHGWYRGYPFSICGLWARVKHFIALRLRSLETGLLVMPKRKNQQNPRKNQLDMNTNTHTSPWPTLPLPGERSAHHGYSIISISMRI